MYWYVRYDYIVGILGGFIAGIGAIASDIMMTKLFYGTTIYAMWSSLFCTILMLAVWLTIGLIVSEKITDKFYEWKNWYHE